MTAEARDLVRRLRALQDRRHELTDAKDHIGAHQALDLAISLVDPCGLPTLREALLHATNPANTPPIPVVLGPQDVAQVVGRDEIAALITAYGQACMAYGSSQGDRVEEGRACQRTFRELHAAVERLCRAAPAYELGGGRTS